MLAGPERNVIPQDEGRKLCTRGQSFSMRLMIAFCQCIAGPRLSLVLPSVQFRRIVDEDELLMIGIGDRGRNEID